nr:PREDICTED: CD209 antigen-like protein E isoform X1 [Lepisosteus oculatus]
MDRVPTERRQSMGSERIYSGLVNPDEDVYGTLDKTPHNHPSAPPTQETKPSPSPYRLATVCLGLLWAVTLPAIIALCVYYSRGSQSGKEEHIIQSANNPQLMNELLEVRVNYSTLSAKNYRLQRDYRNLKAENTILQKEKRSLQNEKDGYQKEKAELQREITGLQSQITEMRRICTPCQQGWELFNFKCYLFSTYKLSWNESRNLCRLTESDLVIVESRKEQEFLISNLKKDNYWIGLTDTAEEGTFLWVDGSRDTRGFWDSGQPNDPNGNHDCVAIYPRSSSLNAWNDIPCSASRSWICEVDAVRFTP